ncbi:TetR/AcrR family transcriptional regulator [Mycolicibacterium komossense]|uniref:TetR/AcrR family transcriptional regulator n=1 Tax=Mycolicibacterium komossense TaxID=1779 RepID=A0ABT3CF56_9MYCO|nr:TetR/AcrR family transcriptional regulator [Mycolicibacterium komossense]MCV7228134.1 TetR/AcrR family transcriptional regulator [Mycolicibacterium komossense]
MAKPVSPRGLARERVLSAALALFVEHGVHGTSVGMIAERLGVSKAAVYYQFSSKEDIVQEVLRPVVENTSRVIKIAEALPTWEAQRAVVISGLVEMAVGHRQLTAVFHADPAIAQVGSPELRAATDRLRELLEGPDPDPTSRIAITLFFAGVGSVAADPQFADIDDDDLHRALLDLSNRILQPATNTV